MSQGHARTDVLSFLDPGLQQVRAVLREAWAGTAPVVQPLIQGGALDGGKMLRPSLLLLSGGLFGEITADHIRAAAVLELVHTASLLHDDVLDHGELRRGVPTVNRRWGNHAAVLLGDLVLGQAFELSATLDRDCRAVLARMIERTCDGEIHQTDRAGDFEITEREYLRVLSRKTAALFKGACRLGARLAGASARECRAIGRFGHNAGMAYQIMDDLLDITGSHANLRKTLGTDVQRAKITLPLIHWLRGHTGPETETLRRGLASGSLTAADLSPLLEESGSVAYVRARIDRYLDRATRALRSIPPTPVQTALITLLRRCCHATPSFPVERQVAGQFRSSVLPARCVLASPR